MSYTDTTENLGLPIYVASDKPSYLGDWNETMNKLDTGYGTVDTIRQNVEALETSVSGIQEEVTGIQGDIAGINTELDGKAPTQHASEQSTYGVGSASLYGHVKLSDTSGTSDASNGAAATPKAVADAEANALTLVNGVRNSFTYNMDPVGCTRLFGYCHVFPNLGIMIMKGRFTATTTIAVGTPFITLTGATKTSANDDINGGLHYVGSGNTGEFYQNLHINANCQIMSYSQIVDGVTFVIDAVVDINGWGGSFAPVNETGAN